MTSHTHIRFANSQMFIPSSVAITSLFIFVMRAGRLNIFCSSLTGSIL